MTELKLYDTMTRQKVNIAVSDQPIKIYSCGPTVYDYPHIGNWYSFLRWDTLNRVLLHLGYKTNWVTNITDVGHLVSDEDVGQDKLEKGAAREGKTAWDVAKFYTDDYLQSLKMLNFSTPDTICTATDYIPEQINMVQNLLDKGYGYVIDDGVYYDTSKFTDYGKLARLKLDNLKEGARVATNTQKRNATDFALWKFSPVGEKRDMEWQAFGQMGFPGWHIECSAMCKKILGDTLDIHCGGIDHIPVHHTNEIAQSEAANGVKFSKIWLHNAFILVDGAKMSKSKGNFYTLHDIIAKGYDPLVYRLYAMTSHYRSEANFSWKGMDEAAAKLIDLMRFAVLRYQADGNSTHSMTDFINALADDLNTAQALAELSSITSLPVDQVSVTLANEFIATVDATLGLKLSDIPDISISTKKLIDDRITAKQNKQYKDADAIRIQLESDGILLSDISATRSIWYYKS
jgi:cysteinyl-tRNA synthetase